MDFLKKYWWAILLIVLLIVGYYLWMKKQATTKTTDKKPASCTTVTQAVYDAKVAEYVAAIEATPDWLDDVTADIKPGETLADAKRRHAQFMTENTMKYCKPAAA